MISITRATVLVMALLGLSPLIVQAQHAASMFEAEKEVTVTGVVKEFQYTNPHSWLLVDVTNKDGSVTTWGFEAEGPGVLMRNGIRKRDFTGGTKLATTPLRRVTTRRPHPPAAAQRQRVSGTGKGGRVKRFSRLFCSAFASPGG